MDYFSKEKNNYVQTCIFIFILISFYDALKHLLYLRIQ